MNPYSEKKNRAVSFRRRMAGLVTVSDAARTAGATDPQNFELKERRRRR